MALKDFFSALVKARKVVYGVATCLIVLSVGLYLVVDGSPLLQKAKLIGSTGFVSGLAYLFTSSLTLSGESRSAGDSEVAALKRIARTANQWLNLATWWSLIALSVGSIVLSWWIGVTGNVEGMVFLTGAGSAVALGSLSSAHHYIQAGEHRS